MNTEIFKSDRYFTIFDFVISHGQLLLRSQKTDDLPKNIDVIFFDTTFIQSFSRLKGLHIKRLGKGIDLPEYSTVKKYLDYDNNYLYEIDSNDEKYYIAASFVRIFENQLEFSESSLNTSEKGMEIATSIT